MTETSQPKVEASSMTESSKTQDGKGEGAAINKYGIWGAVIMASLSTLLSGVNTAKDAVSKEDMVDHIEKYSPYSRDKERVTGELSNNTTQLAQLRAEHRQYEIQMIRLQAQLESANAKLVEIQADLKDLKNRDKERRTFGGPQE